MALYRYVQGKMLADKMNYIFLDEIQHVAQYEKAVDSLFLKKTRMYTSPAPTHTLFPASWQRCFQGGMWN